MLAVFSSVGIAYCSKYNFAAMGLLDFFSAHQHDSKKLKKSKQLKVTS